MKRGFMGTAANPPHNGHIAIGEYVRTHQSLDRIVLMPGYISPHKGILSASPEDRLAMSRLAIQGLSDWEVSDLEIKKEDISYTQDTIVELKKMYPHDELYWIIGLDNLVHMKDGWKGGYDVLDMCRFIVVPRYLYSFDSFPEYIRKKVIFLKGAPEYPVSSSIIRECVKKGQDIHTYISPHIYDYIKKHSLYI